MFEAVILAGGFGTRLSSISKGVPKPMMPIRGEPFLYRLMRNLEECGCEKIVLSLHYKSELIISRVNADLPVKCLVEFVVENEPLGTGGALKKAAENISGQKFISINGDTFVEIDYEEIYQKSSLSDITIAGMIAGDSSRYGNLIVDEQGVVTDFNEKQLSGEGLINCGVYVLPTSQLFSFEKDRFSLEQDFFPSFQGRIRMYELTGLFIDIGVPEDFLYACKVLP